MLIVNQEPLEFEPGMRVIDIIRARNYLFPLLIVRVNGKHVPREEYHTTRVPDESEVQVIHLMSGG